MFSAWVAKWINQFAHVFAGAYLTLFLSLHLVRWQAALAVLAFASIKEGIFDPLIETMAEQGNGWVDWAFFLVGIGLGLLSSI